MSFFNHLLFLQTLVRNNEMNLYNKNCPHTEFQPQVTPAKNTRRCSRQWKPTQQTRPLNVTFTVPPSRVPISVNECNTEKTFRRFKKDLKNKNYSKYFLTSLTSQCYHSVHHSLLCPTFFRWTDLEPRFVNSRDLDSAAERVYQS